MTSPDGSRSPLAAPHLRRLLVLRLDNLGDVVLTGPALRSIKTFRPDLHLTLLASPGGAPAAALLPWIDDVRIARVLWQDLGRLPFDPARERALIDDLRRGAYDVALILTSFSQSPHPAALACALAGIPVRIGASRERGRALTIALPFPPTELHQAERNLRLVEALGVPVAERRLAVHLSPATRAAARALLAARIAGDYLVFNPFTSCHARTFDPARFAAAARRLADDSGLSIVLCGAERDRPRSRPLLDILGPRALDLVGRTDLSTFAAVIAGARLVLTGNTAALHLADALGVPQLVLYAGTDLPSQWAPRVSPHLLLHRPVPCSPCYRFECPHAHACLDFSSRQIAAAGLDLLATATA